MAAKVAAKANGSDSNGHANGDAAKVKSSAAKSRGALKRLKAKQKGKGGGSVSGAEAASDAGAESDAEVSYSDGMRVSKSTGELTRQSVASVSTTASNFDFGPILDPSDPAFAAFADVFAHFQEQDEEGFPVDGVPAKGQVYYSDDEDEDEEQAERRKKAADESGMTRREKRKAAVSSPLHLSREHKLTCQKLSVAELKQLVERPEVVEWFDCDARDPRLLVTLKSYRK